MAQLNFGGVLENVVTEKNFHWKSKRNIKNETVAVIGYGVQYPGQALNLKDNGVNVIVGQRKGTKSWDKALADGWVENETLFEVETACEKGTFDEFTSDAGQNQARETMKNI